MSVLVLEEMYPGRVFIQRFKILRNLNASHVRVWVYLQDYLQDGQFQCRVKDGATLLATSNIDYTDINAAHPLPFAHGFIRFDFESLALRIPEGQVEKEYTLEFEMVNHTINTTNYLGVCRSWENLIYEAYETFPNDFVRPAGYEIFNNKAI